MAVYSIAVHNVHHQHAQKNVPLYCCSHLRQILTDFETNPSRSYGASPAIRDHSVTCHPTQVSAPRLNPSHAGRYLIYLPRGGWKAELTLVYGWLCTEMVNLSADSNPVFFNLFALASCEIARGTPRGDSVTVNWTWQITVYLHTVLVINSSFGCRSAKVENITKSQWTICARTTQDYCQVNTGSIILYY